MTRDGAIVLCLNITRPPLCKIKFVADGSLLSLYKKKQKGQKLRYSGVSRLDCVFTGFHLSNYFRSFLYSQVGKPKGWCAEGYGRLPLHYLRRLRPLIFFPPLDFRSVGMGLRTLQCHSLNSALTGRRRSLSLLLLELPEYHRMSLVFDRHVSRLTGSYHKCDGTWRSEIFKFF